MFDSLQDWFISFAHDQNNPLGLLVLFLGAGVEYVFPPFPGDTLTVIGAAFVTGYGWSLYPVAAASLLGSLAGSLIAFRLGLRWKTRRDLRQDIEPTRLDALVAGFSRHGPAYLVLNRFLPGVRPIFFVAAGLAGMRYRQVLWWGGLSSVLWTAILCAIGLAVGTHIDTMIEIVAKYSLAAIAVMLAIAVVLAARHYLRKRSDP